MRMLVLGGGSTLASYFFDAMESQPFNTIVSKSDVGDFKTLMGLGAPIDVVINFAAKTYDVSQFSRYGEPVGRQPTVSQLVAVNGVGATNVALLARGLGAYLIHVSCDRVLGTFGPYYVTEPPVPQDEVGESKRAGELGVEAVMKGFPYVIVRFPWLYGARYHGCSPMAAVSRAGARISDEERGMPMHGGDAADTVRRLVAMHQHGETYEGLVHVGSTRKPLTWYEFLEPNFPHIEPVRRQKTINTVTGLYPSDIEWSVGFGMERFMDEIRRHPLTKGMRRR